MLFGKNKIVAFSIGIAMGIFCPSKANASDDLLDLPVTLRDSVEVIGKEIHLGDIFSGIPASKENTAIAKSPALGKDVVLTAKWLNSIAQKYGLAWSAANGATTINVTRAATKLDKNDFMQTLFTALDEAGLPKGAEISLSGLNLPVLIPQNANYEIKYNKVELNLRSKSFRAQAVISTDEEEFTTSLSGKIQSFVSVVVAARDLPAGYTLSSNDLTVQKIPSDKYHKNPINDLSMLIGKETKRPARMGQALEETDVRSPTLITKGKAVKIYYKKTGLTLSATGKALEAGGLNETIRVMNTQSKTIVQATITSQDTVDVISVGTK
ncbi:MAG: flagellar basal body P-ring formation chaperone FlgA [Alphaproteobacteria bacterium]|nr:flagellar basal body P-ring formation chaperone FlgA [Alphaproteobacteria bacterium]